MKSIKKTDHFFLIDGSGYIFRAYYALPPLSRKSDGLPTGAVNGFCSMLFKLLEQVRSGKSEYKPTHFAVIFDSARKNFRNEIYKDYKANRAEAPDDLAPQFEYIRKSVKAFNLPSIEMLNYEADDLIATYCKIIKNSGARATVVSSDKDLMQLLSKNIQIYDPMKSKYINEEDVIKKFGVKSDKVIDVQSLAGDSSDNVPGVPGIGIKTAAELIKTYNNLDNLLKNVEKIPQKKRRETLIENKKQALISRDLVTLKDDVPIKEEPSTFELKEINKSDLFNFLKEMEFNRLLSTAISFYGGTFKDIKKDIKKQIIDRKKYICIKDLKELSKLIKTLENRKVIAIDTETTSLDPIEAELLGVSISFDKNKSFYIPISHKGEKLVDKKIVLKNLKSVFENKNIIKVGQNLKYDLSILKKYNITLNSYEDTMLISYVLDAGLNRHNLDTLSEIHLDHKTITYKELTGSGKNKKKFEELDLRKVTEYAGEDADVTKRLFDMFNSRLTDKKLKLIYEKFEKPMINVLSKIEKNGIKVDRDYLKKLSKKFNERLIKIENEIFKIAKKKFNIASPKQLGEIIYNDLKIAKLKKTKKGSMATSALVLEDLAIAGHEFPKLVLNWRQLTKLKNTYTDSLQEHISLKTNKVHTSFLLAATNTARLASSDPNLQNIPIKTEDGREIRKSFIAQNGNVLVSSDYNQIEMRILADIANVQELKKAFKNKQDIHTLTASEVFNLPKSKINEDLRRKAKAINFGIIYGITQYGLAKQLSVSNSEALIYIDSYFKKFPEIKDYMSQTVKFCRKNGFVENVFGRRIHLRNINDKNFAVRSFQERAAINAPIQSTAADIIRLSMIEIDKLIENKKIIDTKMLLQIHDELIFECSVEEKRNSEIKISETMESIINNKYHNFSVPLKVSVNSGYNWGEANKI